MATPAPAKKKPGCLPALIAVIVAAAIIAVIAVAVSGGTKKGPQPVSPALVDDIQTVNAGVENVMVSIGQVIKDNGDTQTAADLNQMASQADQEHTALTSEKDQIAVDAPLNTDGADLSLALNELKNSMAALGAYTANPNPSTLASFTDQFNQGVSDWDSAVAQIYAGSTSGPPPTIPDTASGS